MDYNITWTNADGERHVTPGAWPFDEAKRIANDLEERCGLPHGVVEAEEEVKIWALLLGMRMDAEKEAK